MLDVERWPCWARWTRQPRWRRWIRCIRWTRWTRWTLDVRRLTWDVGRPTSRRTLHVGRCTFRRWSFVDRKLDICWLDAGLWALYIGSDGRSDVERSEVGHYTPDFERLRLHVERWGIGRWDVGRWTAGPLDRWDVRTLDVRTLNVGRCAINTLMMTDTLRECRLNI